MGKRAVGMEGGFARDVIRTSKLPVGFAAGNRRQTLEYLWVDILVEKPNGPVCEQSVRTAGVPGRRNATGIQILTAGQVDSNWVRTDDCVPGLSPDNVQSSGLRYGQRVRPSVDDVTFPDGFVRK